MNAMATFYYAYLKSPDPLNNVYNQEELLIQDDWRASESVTKP